MKARSYAHLTIASGPTGSGEPMRRRRPGLLILAATLMASLAFAPGLVSCSGAPKPSPAPAPAPAPSPPPPVEKPAPNLSDLIAAGDEAGIRTFFANQEQLSLPDAKGSYPLHRAIEKGSAQTVELLLVLGAKIEVKDSQGRSPLRLAVDTGSADCAKILVSRGADTFSLDASGRSVAEAALAKGPAMIQVVFNRDNVNARAADGSTVLHVACDRLLEDAVARLLAAGADVSLRDKVGRSPLDLALLHPDRIEAARIAELLIQKGAGPSYPDFSWFSQAARAVDYNSLRFEDGATALHEATSHRQRGFVEFLLSRKVNPNSRNSAGSTPLHEAVRSGWLDGAELLMKNGADPNARDGFDNTPLHIALPDEGRKDGVALLLRYGADPSLKDRNGNTPLHVAIQVGYPVPMIEELIAAKAPVNATNAAGDGALMLALRAKRYDYAKPLLDAGADIFLVNARAESPLSLAVAAGPDALDAIITAANVKSKDNFGNGPLALAVGLKASPQSIALLVSKGAEPNARNNAGDTALHLTVRQNLKEQGEALILAKADIFVANVRGESPLSIALTARGGPIDWLFTADTVTARDANGETCLHHAARRNLASALEFLVGKGAVLDAANGSGETPLHAAVKADSAEAARALLSLGAQSAARDTMGDTPLHAAVLWGARKSLPVLVLAGVDLNARDFAGEAPLNQAVRKKDRESARFLLDHGADPDSRDNRGASPLSTAARSGSADLVRDLLAAKADVANRDLAGRTPLLEAADLGDVETTRLLVGAGADIMARDSDGDSPLGIALKRSMAVLKTLLISANVNRADPDGMTPLRIAVESKASNEALDLVLSNGADIDQRDRYSDTALNAALRTGNLELAGRLAKAGADLFARDKDGETPVSMAMAKGTEALKTLVTAAGIGARDVLGNGLLHYAAVSGSSEAAAWLLAAGADRSARNISGETAADVAEKRGKTDLATLLKPGK